VEYPFQKRASKIALTVPVLCYPLFREVMM
jgi:hypothetical protein